MRPRLSAAGGGAGLLLFVAAVSAAALALAEAFGKVGVAERSRLGKALLWDSLSTAGGGGGEGQHGVSPNRLNRHILRERGEGGGESNDVRREMQFGATNGRLSKSGGGGTRPNSVSSDEAVGRKREALKRLLARRMWKKRLRNALKMKEKLKQEEEASKRQRGTKWSLGGTPMGAAKPLMTTTTTTTTIMPKVLAASRRMDDGDDDDVGERKMLGKDRDEMLATQVKAVTVLNMVRQMQEEIRRLNRKIREENELIKVKEAKVATILTPDGNADTSKDDNDDDVDNEVLGQEIERMAIMQTVRELKLRKEDNRMKAIETQIKMKRLQESNGAKIKVLDTALGMVRARRKLIGEAIKQQREITSERQRLAQEALDKRKEIDVERKKLVQEMKREQELQLLKQEEERQRQISEALGVSGAGRGGVSGGANQKQIRDRTKSLLAHKNLMQESNGRVAQKLRDLTVKRRQEAGRVRNALARQQLAQLTAGAAAEISATDKALAKLRRINRKRRPLLSRLRANSPLRRLTVSEMNQVLSWLDMERNAEILATTDEKIAQKSRANLAAQNLIRDAAQVAIGENNFAFTDSEVDDLLGLAELGPTVTEEVVDLDYYSEDYPVDLEEILADYIFEYDDPILTPVVPSNPVAPPVPVPVPVPAPPAVPLAPAPVIPAPLLPAAVHPPKAPKTYGEPLAPPQSYQYFYHPKPLEYGTPKPYYHHPPPPPPPPPLTKPHPDPIYHEHHHYHEPEPYKPESYYEPEPYHKTKQHHVVHHDEYHLPKRPYQHYDHYKPDPHVGKYKAPPPPPPPPPKPVHHYPEPELYADIGKYKAPPPPPPKPSPYRRPKHYYKKEPHYYDHQYEAEPYREPKPPYRPYHEPDPYQPKPDPYHHKPNPYHRHKPKLYHPSAYGKPGPPYHLNGPHPTPLHPPPPPPPHHHHHHHGEALPPPQTGAEFLDSIVPALDAASLGGFEHQGTSAVFRQSLLKDIQHKLDAELNYGPGGQRTRVTIGHLPPEPPRDILVANFFGRRTDEEEERKQGEKGLSFSELMSDFLRRRPLPFRDPANASKTVASR